MQRGKGVWLLHDAKMTTGRRQFHSALSEEILLMAGTDCTDVLLSGKLKYKGYLMGPRPRVPEYKYPVCSAAQGSEGSGAPDSWLSGVYRLSLHWNPLHNLCFKH